MSGRCLGGRSRPGRGAKLFTPAHSEETCRIKSLSGQQIVAMSNPNALAAAYHRLAVPPRTSQEP